MPRSISGVILSVIFAGLVAGAVVWYAGRLSSYDECVVSEMRTQAQHMLSAVQRLCATRFRKEEELSLSLLREKLDFMMLPDFDKDPGVLMVGGKLEKAPWVVTVTKNDADYEVTRARMKHSFKWQLDCSSLADDDWKEGPEFAFVNGVANVIMPTEWDGERKLYRAPFCYRYVKIWAMPRKG